MSVTIKDLAKETGLSVATISAYVNGEKVREKNRLKIQQAIRSLGYIRNDYARSLKTSSSKTIGVVVPEMHTKIIMRILAEIQAVLRGYGYGTIICDSRMDKDLERQAFTFMLSKMADGFIVFPVTGDPSSLDVLRENGKPVVVVNALKERRDVSHIQVDNLGKFRQALNDIIRKGKKRIAIIYSGVEFPMIAGKLKVYEEVMKKAGLFDERYMFATDYTVKGGYEAAAGALALDPSPEAVLVCNYEMSIGALTAIGQRDKKVRESITFVGVDLDEDRDLFEISPSSVNRPVAEIGRQTAELIVGAVERGEIRDVVLTGDYVKGRI